MTPAELTSTSQMGGITLQMRVMAHRMCCLSHIGMCDTICPNGIVPKIRKLLIVLIFLADVLPSPRNPKELFNLRHASAHNVIEQIFGILKRRFRILHLPLEYGMDVQTLIPPALAALHNFIRDYDPEEIHNYDDEALDIQMGLPPEPAGELGAGPATSEERARASERRDKIAADMWEQYQRYLDSPATRNSVIV